MHHKSLSGRIFDTCNLIFLAVLAVSVLYPFVYVFNLSISTAAEASRGGLHLYPKEITLDAYRAIFADPTLVRALVNSFVRTLLGTVLTVICSVIAAYPLSRKDLPARRYVTFMILFTMVFSGGLVPTYLLIRGLGMLDTLSALILPTLLSAFNIIIIKNFFQSIPESFNEAARIDGAGDWTILFKIYLPLSTPVLATIALWTAVAHWNAWFDAMLYIASEDKQVLQVILQRIVIDSSTQFLEFGMGADALANYNPQTLKAATTIITVLPILCLYPLLQRYFNKGIMLGGIKE